LAQVGRLTEAAAACRAVIERQSDHVDAHINLGIALCHQGHIAESVVALRRAHALAPERADCFSNLLFISNYHAELAPNTLAELHRGFGRKYETVAVAGHANDRSPGRRLRIGYVSPDFRQHSVANFLEALLQGHNTDAIEVSCYAAVKSPDAVTARLQAQAARWRNVMGLTDAAVADMIRTDGIDILIDLAGHTAGNRLGVFARKPAPVQATYLGYPNTTGLARIDYRITDAEADPPGADDRLYSERLYRLSRCFLAYRPVAEVPVVTARPSAAAKSITFGSFNMLAKMSPQTIAAWAAVLRARPEARLVIKSAPLVDRATGERTHAWFAEHGIATNRVQLVPFMQNRGRHFAAYGQIDIALDTFPYNGTTTTCEALWMGVPVVTSAGDRHAARVGKSLLHAIGLDELVAPSVEGYVTLACELAADRARVAALSLGLRERVAASPLCDARGLAQTLEAAYRDMWQRWCVQA
jgi:protein O-GlcNAc transferase